MKTIAKRLARLEDETPETKLVGAGVITPAEAATAYHRMTSGPAVAHEFPGNAAAASRAYLAMIAEKPNRRVGR
ncbi:MAG: hypothetical protein WCJ64_04550 [Rhodospirillaceae bacterium]